LPTYTRLPRFDRDFAALTPEERRQFAKAVGKGLRVKGVQGSRGVYEMTWAPNGRATFSYGTSIQGGEPHVIWRRVGKHEILGSS